MLDAIDFGLPPGTLRVLRDHDVPALSAQKLSPHQTGLTTSSLAKLRGQSPQAIRSSVFSPKPLDLGGSLRDVVRARLNEAIERRPNWMPGATNHGRGRKVLRLLLNASALALDVYERDRPSEDAACHVGDARLLAGSAA